MSANYNPFSLAGKKILVTGASSGIGQRTAIECSRLGAQVVITARNEERLQETFSKLEGEGHEALIADLTNNAQLEKLISLVREINGVVLCAGKSMTAPFPFCTPEKFEEVFRVNFLESFGQTVLCRFRFFYWGNRALQFGKWCLWSIKSSHPFHDADLC